MKTKIAGIEIKDILLILLVVGNIYQWVKINRLNDKVEECSEMQSDFVKGIQAIVERKKDLDITIAASDHRKDSINKLIDSLDTELAIVNNRLYRLNKHHEKKYRIYDTASVNQLKQYFSRELFKN